jgi:hypothetical protein
VSRPRSSVALTRTRPLRRRPGLSRSRPMGRVDRDNRRVAEHLSRADRRRQLRERFDAHQHALHRAHGPHNLTLDGRRLEGGCQRVAALRFTSSPYGDARRRVRILRPGRSSAPAPPPPPGGVVTATLRTGCPRTVRTPSPPTAHARARRSAGALLPARPARAVAVPPMVRGG